jgi:uncharacterized protein
MNQRYIVPSAIVAGGLILASLIFGLFFNQARGTPHTISVTGSATQPFVSDIAKWRLTLSRSVADGGQTDGYRQLREDAERLRERLRVAGVADTAMSLLPPTAQPQWGPNGVRTGYNLQQPIYIISASPGLEQLALDPGAFTSAGTGVDQSSLEYFLTDIARLKHSLLGAATRDAQRRAEEIAKSTGSNVGGVISARAGVFQITEPYSTEVSGMGMYNTSTRAKEITVTVHASFALR